jgi:hypothetical protein
MFYNYNLNGIVTKKEIDQFFFIELPSSFCQYYLVNNVFIVNGKQLQCALHSQFFLQLIYIFVMYIHCSIIVFNGRHHKIKFASSGWFLKKMPSLFDTHLIMEEKIKLLLASLILSFVKLEFPSWGVFFFFFHSISSHFNPFLFTKYHLLHSHNFLFHLNMINTSTSIWTHQFERPWTQTFNIFLFLT